MPRATPEYPTPKLCQVRFVCATPPVAVELHQPIAPGEVRIITGRVLGAMHVDGQVHHYRVEDGNGSLLLVPADGSPNLGSRCWETRPTDAFRFADISSDLRTRCFCPAILDEKDETRLLSDVVAAVPALTKRGEIGNGRSRGVHNTSTIQRGSTNTEYLAARLKRDAPEIAERINKFPSITAAARAEVLA